MTLSPGDAVLGGDVSQTLPAAADVEAGDAVASNAGEMAKADLNGAGEVAGIARHAADAPEGNSLVLCAAVVANVEAGVTEGSRLGSPDSTDVEVGDPAQTPGELVPTPEDGSNFALALSDEGGTWHGRDGTYDVPDGYAVVFI